MKEKDPSKTWRKIKNVEVVKEIIEIKVLEKNDAPAQEKENFFNMLLRNIKKIFEKNES